jgi:NAD(P)-dependent dehydrogenase (short-subunit alcohol dehydrogenase family)
MAERGAGTIIFVLGSETRGGPAQYAAYSASKVAQRALAEACAYEFMHRGVHAIALDVDGAVGLPRVTAGMPEEEPDHFVSTEAICGEIVHLINQPRNAWTFAVDLRSYWQWRPRVAAKKKP